MSKDLAMRTLSSMNCRRAFRVGRLIRTLTYCALALAIAPACGGTQAGRTGKDGAHKANQVVDENNNPINQVAVGEFEKGTSAFDEAEAAGWTKESCAKAKAAFDSAIRTQTAGRFAEARFMRGAVAERCGDQAEAEGYYRQAFDANSKLCEAQVALGVIALRKGDAVGARARFEKALKDDHQCTSAYANLAALQRRQGGAQVDEALSNLRRALAIESDYLPAFNEMALLYMQKADAAKGAQSRQAALDLGEIVCRQAQLIRSNYAPIYNTWGLIKMRKQDIIEALRFFEKAVKLDDSMYEAHMNFAAITLSFRGYEDAHRSYSRAAALDPKSYEAVVGLGAALRGLGRSDEAKLQYDKALSLDGSRPEAYFNLALLYHNFMNSTIPELEKAKSYYQQFAGKAGGKSAFAEQLQEVQRRCKDAEPGAEPRKRGSKKKRQRHSNCRPGPIQLIDITIHALREAEAMQREVEAMRRQAGGG